MRGHSIEFFTPRRRNGDSQDLNILFKFSQQVPGRPEAIHLSLCFPFTGLPSKLFFKDLPKAVLYKGLMIFMRDVCDSMCVSMHVFICAYHCPEYQK